MLLAKSVIKSTTCGGGAETPKTPKAYSYGVVRGAEVGYSRKTARGASSPAKPALHIPELHWCQLTGFRKYQSAARWS